MNGYPTGHLTLLHCIQSPQIKILAGVKLANYQSSCPIVKVMFCFYRNVLLFIVPFIDLLCATIILLLFLIKERFLLAQGPDLGYSRLLFPRHKSAFILDVEYI